MSDIALDPIRTIKARIEAYKARPHESLYARNDHGVMFVVHDLIYVLEQFEQLEEQHQLAWRRCTSMSYHPTEAHAEGYKEALRDVLKALVAGTDTIFPEPQAGVWKDDSNQP